jgi:protein TonB
MKIVLLASLSAVFGVAAASAQQGPPWQVPVSDFGGAEPENLRAWFRVEDYPTDAMRRNERGFVTVRFQILPNGRVGECSVIRTSGHKRLDRVPCRLLEKRARFKPAKDAGGAAVTTVGTTSMLFWMP